MTFSRLAGLAAVVSVIAFAAARAQDAPPTGDAGGHGHARGVMRQACGADIARFCSDVHAGGGRVMACFKAHRDDLSDGCKSALAAVRAERRGETSADATPH